MAEPTELPTGQKETGLPRDRGRRRLLQGGVGASPLLLTLVSRPVLGNGIQCFSPSGFVSMPTSQHGEPQFCLGRTPGFWRQPQKFNEWPKPYYPVAVKNHPATKFKTVFTPAGPYETMTLLDVVSIGAGPPNDVGRHIVATLLNVKKGWAPALTLEGVKNIWTEYMTTGGGLAGYYEPTAGVKWFHDQIVDYLLSLTDGSL